jgi:pimeloyl-ACP methyl ester carboxylesterase
MQDSWPIGQDRRVTVVRVDVGGQALDLDAEFTPATGPADRPALVFLHEGLGSLGLWRSFPAEVRAACGGPATLVYSRAGYGRSGPAPRPWPVTYMHHEADAVLPALLSAFGIERPVLIGHSDGASIALLCAGTGQDVAALVVLAPHVFVEDLSVASIAQVRETYRTTGWRERLARHHDSGDDTFYRWNDVWLDPNFRSWNIEDRLRQITCPVLAVQGEDDEYGTLRQLDAIGAGVAGPVRRLVLPGVGHAPHVDAPVAVRDAIVGFLSDAQLT